MVQTLKEYLDEKLKANSLKAPDRNPLVAPQADLAKKVKALLNKYETKKVGKIDSPWNKYGAGMSFGDLLFGESPELLDDISYGKNPLTSGGRTGRIPIPDKRLLDIPVPIPSTGGMGVIKNKGGNWLTGSVERALNGLKKSIPSMADLEDLNIELPNELVSELVKTHGNGGIGWNQKIINDPRYIEFLRIRDPQTAANSWIDNTLTKYVKNRMATPSDEVRKLADQGILHYTPEPLPSHNRIPVVSARKEGGFPIDGMADNHVTGTAWEDTADWMLLPERADEFIHEFTGNPNIYDEKILAENPWLTKVDPSTPIHTLQPDALRYSGIPHLIDELLNATNPESKFPQHLRMKPEGFKGLTMEEAVRKVHGINQHRVVQAEAARKKFSRADGISTSKKYDDGFRFVAPEDVTKNPKHREYVVDAGKRGAWCTQGQACDHYAGGNSRVEILLDDFGNPHAQIAIETANPSVSEKISTVYKRMSPERQAEIDKNWDTNLDTNNNWFDAMKNSPEYQAYLQEPPVQRITEIKPLANSWDSDKVQELMAKDPNYKAKIQEKLQDFVKSGNWSDVSDLENIGLYRQGDRFMSKEDFLNEPGFKEWLNNRYDRPQNDDEILGYYQTFIRDTQLDGGI